MFGANRLEIVEKRVSSEPLRFRRANIILQIHHWGFLPKLIDLGEISHLIVVLRACFRHHNVLRCLGNFILFGNIHLEIINNDTSPDGPEKNGYDFDFLKIYYFCFKFTTGNDNIIGILWFCIFAFVFRWCWISKCKRINYFLFFFYFFLRTTKYSVVFEWNRHKIKYQIQISLNTRCGFFRCANLETKKPQTFQQRNKRLNIPIDQARVVAEALSASAFRYEIKRTRNR